eukprot:9397575-Pyramimonas_sp.AAC.1
MRDEDARALDAHFEAVGAARGQRKWPRIERGKDAKVPLGRLPILTMRVDCSRRSPRRESRQRHLPP